MKEWIHRIPISIIKLEEELNGLSRCGYEIFKIWKTTYGYYEIIAYKEKK